MNPSEKNSARDGDQLDDCLSYEALDRGDASFTVNHVCYSRGTVSAAEPLS